LDKREVEILAALAGRDSWETGLVPWVDAPSTSDAGVPTLTALAPVDTQIETEIRNADAILYVVGSFGLGPYQRDIEAPLVEAVLKERREAGRPIQFVPVLLSEGRASDLPDWARSYTIVNHDRSARSTPALWEKIKQRLSAPPGDGEPNLAGAVGNRPAAPAHRAPEWHEDVEMIRESLFEPPRLTVFIGPYSLESRERNPRGPAAVSRHLLNEIGIDPATLMPILPWPSEAAQWAMFRQSRPKVQSLMRQLFQSLGTNPPELARSVAELARRWEERYRDRPAQGWHGLLLITTRTDLALESALTKIAMEDFTRILPTLNDSSQTGKRKQMVQHWDADANWDALPDHLERGPRRRQLVDHFPPETTCLKDYSMDPSRRIALIKLCGSIDIPESLILTASDFFANMRNLDSLPREINEIIGASAHLLLGRGFASPLAQLIRHNVLREPRDWPRIWVVDNARDDSGEADTLCDLELNLLEGTESRKQSMEPLKYTRLSWAPEDAFLLRLAASL
jgi:hypothetical protein